MALQHREDLVHLAGGEKGGIADSIAVREVFPAEEEPVVFADHLVIVVRLIRDIGRVRAVDNDIDRKLLGIDRVVAEAEEPIVIIVEFPVLIGKDAIRILAVVPLFVVDDHPRPSRRLDGQECPRLDLVSGIELACARQRERKKEARLDILVFAAVEKLVLAAGERLAFPLFCEHNPF